MYRQPSEALIVDYLPRLNISSFSKPFKLVIKRAEALRAIPPKEELIFRFTLNDIRYSAILSMSKESIGEDAQGKVYSFYLDSLLFKWKDTAGEWRSQLVFLYERRSPLGGSPFYDFLCLSGIRCRVLYATSEGYLFGRKAFKNAHYKSEYEKVSKRPILRALSLLALRDKDPYRRNGKEYYGGKLTPYGKRLRKYESLCKTFANTLRDLQKQ